MDAAARERNTRLLTLRVVWRNLLFQDHLVGVHIVFFCRSIIYFANCYPGSDLCLKSGSTQWIPLTSLGLLHFVGGKRRIKLETFQLLKGLALTST